MHFKQTEGDEMMANSELTEKQLFEKCVRDVNELWNYLISLRESKKRSPRRSQKKDTF